MMRWILMLALALPVLGATEDASARVPAESVPAVLAQAAGPGAGEGAGTGFGAEAPAVDMTPSKPSGFWGTSRPAKGGAYRYRLLGIGAGVALLMGGIVLWVLRRPARSAR